MISEARFARRANKEAFVRITCATCDGGGRVGSRNAPYRLSCTQCDACGYGYIEKNKALGGLSNGA